MGNWCCGENPEPKPSKLSLKVPISHKEKESKIQESPVSPKHDD